MTDVQNFQPSVVSLQVAANDATGSHYRIRAKAYLIASVMLLVLAAMFAPAAHAQTPALIQPSDSNYYGDQPTFTWATKGIAVESWWLYVGSTPLAYDYYNSGQLTHELSTQAVGLPTGGQVAHVTLWYLSDGEWSYITKRLVGRTGSPPHIVLPTQATILRDKTATVTWSDGGKSIDKWMVKVSATRGKSDIYNSGKLKKATRSHVIKNLPQASGKVWITLRYLQSGKWKSRSFRYVTKKIKKPKISSPPTNVQLQGSTLKLVWNGKGTDVDYWRVYAGVRTKTSTYYDSGNLSGDTLSHTLSSLPVNGSVVHVTLYYFTDGAWASREYQYTAHSASQPVTTTVTTVAPPAVTRVRIGNPYGAHGLGNLRIGRVNGYQGSVCSQFKAQHSGAIRQLKPNWVAAANSGYSGGTGGNIRITVENLSGTVYSSGSYRPGLRYGGWNGTDAFSIVNRLTAHYQVRAGTRYRACFRNVDSNPTANYISLNGLWHNRESQSNAQPITSHADWGFFYSSVYGGRSESMKPLYGRAPILQIDYDTNSSGSANKYQGMGYMEVWVRDDVFTNRIGSYYFARQSIFPETNMTAKTFSLFARLRSSGSGKLRALLKDTSGNTLAYTDFAANAFTSGTAHSWATATFNTAARLKAGSKYYIELRSTGSAKWQTLVARDGADGFGWNRATTTRGKAELSFNGGASWTGWVYWNGHGGRTDSDMMFYLDADVGG